MIFRHEAVKKLYSDLVTTVGNKSYDSSGNLIEVDEIKVAEENAKLQAEYDALQYQRDRATSYPSIQEQLDMQYWDRKNGTKKWEEFIDKIKLDNPKPE
jgi:hypothetical protein